MNQNLTEISRIDEKFKNVGDIYLNPILDILVMPATSGEYLHMIIDHI
jgi:hypothetical protein